MTTQNLIHISNDKIPSGIRAEVALPISTAVIPFNFEIANIKVYCAPLSKQKVGIIATYSTHPQPNFPWMYGTNGELFTDRPCPRVSPVTIVPKTEAELNSMQYVDIATIAPNSTLTFHLWWATYLSAREVLSRMVYLEWGTKENTELNFPVYNAEVAEQKNKNSAMSNII